jgi:hypothetical protein
MDLTKGIKKLFEAMPRIELSGKRPASPGRAITKDIRIAAYSLIVMHFLRSTARKLRPDARHHIHVPKDFMPTDVCIITYGTPIVATCPTGKAAQDLVKLASTKDFPLRTAYPLRNLSRDELDILAEGKIIIYRPEPFADTSPSWSDILARTILTARDITGIHPAFGHWPGNPRKLPEPPAGTPSGIPGVHFD